MHTVYADGTARPLYRGWLHGAAALVSVPSAIYSWESIEPAARPTVVAVCWTLSSSAALHLHRYRSKSMEQLVNKLDRTGIVAICLASFTSPQLASAARCRPPLAYTLATVVAPNTLGVLAILGGSRSPRVFGGCVVAAMATGAFWSTVDALLVLYTAASGLCYGLGMYLYVRKPCSASMRWGYHEWMHVLVTVGFGVNVSGVSYMAVLCESEDTETVYGTD